MITVWVISYNARAGSISSTLQEEMVVEKKDRIKKGEKEGERERQGSLFSGPASRLSIPLSLLCSPQLCAALRNDETQAKNSSLPGSPFAQHCKHFMPAAVAAAALADALQPHSPSQRQHLRVRKLFFTFLMLNNDNETYAGWQSSLSLVSF